MIDLKTETPISLEVARGHRLLRTSRGPVDFSTIHKYATRGVRGVKLECIEKPSGLHTTEEAIIRFLEALTKPGGTA